MVHWAWLIAAFILGDMLGIVAMAIIVGSTERAVEKSKKQKRGG